MNNSLTVFRERWNILLDWNYTIICVVKLYFIGKLVAITSTHQE